MIEIPPSLVDRLKGRQDSAGRWSWVARSWLELLNGTSSIMRLCDRVDSDARKAELRTLVAAGRRSAAIAYLGTRLPREVIVDVLTDAYPAQPEVPEAIAEHRAHPLARLVSTGLDGLWAAATGTGRGDVRIFSPAEADALAAHRGALPAPPRRQHGRARQPLSRRCRARLAALGISAALRTVADNRSLVLRRVPCGRSGPGAGRAGAGRHHGRGAGRTSCSCPAPRAGFERSSSRRSWA